MSGSDRPGRTSWSASAGHDAPQALGCCQCRVLRTPYTSTGPAYVRLGGTTEGRVLLVTGPMRTSGHPPESAMITWVSELAGPCTRPWLAPTHQKIRDRRAPRPLDYEHSLRSTPPRCADRSCQDTTGRSVGVVSRGSSTPTCPRTILHTIHPVRCRCSCVSSGGPVVPTVLALDSSGGRVKRALSC